MNGTKFTSVEAYFQALPQKHLPKMEALRAIIQQAIPEASEGISYNMPVYKYNGNLVYFALFSKHIGFYPTPSAIKKFESELHQYTFAKGSIQFPLHLELPEKLIADICRFRLNENKNKP
ncbi:iron chaperone [Flavobacterium sp. UMI-01]|uniref:iron chaperone n=1 Tax=Flavobacterium sp. UMI-01 TaxID=1441053 RepID=UPI001C7DB32D|nr:DUF1801 domain-containing protein [Flavobacterium sp. UMI-01]GIZ07618.1 hypothetical protein FUMI01_03450 [Flavobacterium sp. UMI-01]